MSNENIKTKVLERLQKEQRSIRYNISINKSKINKLAKESTELKRELVELEKLIRILREEINQNE